MPPTPVEALHRRLTELEHQSTLRLKPDELRSLRYLRMAEATDPAGPSPSDRIGAWLHRAHHVEQFVRRTGRLPRENNRLPKESIDPIEQTLADWLRYQRRAATRSLHCEYQRLRLESVPGFSWEPLGDRWDERFAEYVSFIGRQHRIPLYRSADQHERSLAAWATKQRSFLRAGTLPQERARKLASLNFRHRRS